VKRETVILLGPSREAISGVTTHLNSLLGSRLGSRFDLLHFQVGSEGREEGALGKLARLLASPFALAAALVRCEARLVHINTSLNARAYWRDMAYLMVAKLCGARVLYQVHGGLLRDFVFAHRLLKGLIRRMLRWPDAVVVLSLEQRDAFLELAPRQTVEIVPNGIDCTPYLRHERPAPEPRGPLRLIYIGRLAPGKGLLETLEGVRLARSRGFAVRLVLAGDGPEAARLREYARDAGLGAEVSFAGPTFGEHKAHLLSQADAFVLASYGEGLPYSLLEAMAAGAVPVVTPVGAMPDVVIDGEHGLFVAPRDAAAIAAAIAVLASDRAALARMSAACRQRVGGAYSIERVARDFSQLYGALCDAARAPTAVL
jgi:glycosyltransferase involved in cell wall biosynthesis